MRVGRRAVTTLAAGLAVVARLTGLRVVEVVVADVVELVLAAVAALTLLFALRPVARAVVFLA